jgi:hypothetical protein
MKDGRFARRVFIGAGIYGLLGVLPLFFMEPRFVEMFPPALTHPEFFYGFAGVALAWQVAFLVIGSDPARFRPLMLPAVLEKVTYGAGVLWLVVEGRTPLLLVVTAVIDLVLAILFTAAFLRTRASSGGLRLS